MRQTMQPRVLVWETKASKPRAVKTVGVVVVGETPSLTGETVGGAHGALGHTQAHPCRNQHLKGHDPLVGSKGCDSKWG